MSYQGDIDRKDPALRYLDLREGESIQITIRHHWAGFLSKIFLVFAMTIVPIILIFAIYISFDSIPVEVIKLLILGVTGFIVFLLTFLFGAWIHYYYDIIFITQDRILNIDQRGLLSRKVSELPIKHVQNVSSNVTGLLENVFGYGVLIIETAGAGTFGQTQGNSQLRRGYFTITAVPDPNAVARLIMELSRQDDAKRNPGLTDASKGEYSADISE